MEEKHWKVYTHVNKSNGKIYVGITSKEKVEYRWGYNGYGYNKCPRFYSAIKKYGWDNFYHRVIADNLTELEANNIEIFLIKRLRTQNKRYGYNLASGGAGSTGVHPSIETRKKLSKARMRENLSEETLRRRSEGLKGRVFSEEHKSKIGQANSKAVVMLTTDGRPIRTFNSMYEAEQIMGVGHSHISQCCNNKRKTTGGYRWKYA